MSKKSKAYKKCIKEQKEVSFKKKSKQKKRDNFKKKLKLLYKSRKYIMKLLKPVIVFIYTIYDKVA